MQLPKRHIPTKGDGKVGRWLHLKDGESAKGVFRGEAYEFFIKWDGGKSSEVTSGTPGASSRFRLNFVTKIEGKYTAVTWEFGITVYNQLADLNELYPLETSVVVVSRQGATKDDTRYTILPVPGAQLHGEQLKQIESVELNILQGKPKELADDQWDNSYGVPPSYNSDDNLPF